MLSEVLAPSSIDLTTGAKSLRISPDGQHLACGGRDGNLRQVPYSFLFLTPWCWQKSRNARCTVEPIQPKCLQYYAQGSFKAVVWTMSVFLKAFKQQSCGPVIKNIYAIFTAIPVEYALISRWDEQAAKNKLDGNCSRSSRLEIGELP